MDGGAVPGGDLHQDAGGIRLHLRARAAHEAGDRGGPVGVVDHHHARVERAGLPIEGLYLLPVVGAAHNETPAGDAIEVEGVQRLTAQQHRVVGYVNHVVDGPLPGGHQPGLQPRRRGSDRDVVEDARGEARAEVGALDPHLHALHGPDLRPCSLGGPRVLAPGRRC